MEDEACLPVGWAASPISQHNSQAGFGSPAKTGWDENEDPAEFRIEARWAAKQAQAAGASADAASPLAAGGESELRERSAGPAHPDGDLASAWAACEDLQRQLRQREEQLGCALDALDEAARGAAPGSTAFGGGGGALVSAQQETAGQQLSRFLKEQLALRDEELEAARRAAADAAGLAAALDGARAEAHALREENAALEAELAEAHQQARESGADAEEARLELAAVRAAAAEEAEGLRRQVWALEARVSLVDYAATPGEGREGGPSSASVAWRVGGTPWVSSQWLPLPFYMDS